jgi:hypothetical protein
LYRWKRIQWPTHLLLANGHSANGSAGYPAANGMIFTVNGIFSRVSALRGTAMR